MEPVDLWVHSPHVMKKRRCVWSKSTISVLIVLQITVIVAISIIYLPRVADNKYKKLVSYDDDDMINDHEIHEILGIQKPRQLHDRRFSDWESRNLMSENEGIVKPRTKSAGHDELPDIIAIKTAPSLHAARLEKQKLGNKKVTTLGVASRKGAKKKKERTRKAKQRKKKTRKKQGSAQRKKQAREEEKRNISMPYSELFNEKNRTLENVDLLIIVNSAIGFRARRDAIRDTWFTECDTYAKVRCYFFTDDIEKVDKKESKEALKENNIYKDMIFQPIGKGLVFGHRFLYQFQWARARFRFKFLLRMDDDVMLCLQHLLYDLKHFRTNNLQWGYLHCAEPELVYVDEGLIMFSADVVNRYLSQKPAKIRCHPYGDQTIGLWIQDLGMDPYNLYMHDRRIHHDPPASYDVTLLGKQHLCNEYIALHGVYSGYMSEFWSRRGRPSYLKYDEPLTSYLCDKPFVMFWDKFSGKYYYQPDYCYKGNIWQAKAGTKDLTHNSREGRYSADEKESWKYSEDVMDRPKRPPSLKDTLRYS